MVKFDILLTSGELDLRKSFVKEGLNKNSKRVLSGSTTISNCRQPHATARKSHSTIKRHYEDKLSKAARFLFPIKMIAILDWT